MTSSRLGSMVWFAGSFSTAKDAKDAKSAKEEQDSLFSFLASFAFFVSLAVNQFPNRPAASSTPGTP
jgi:hypothetical protein